MNRYLHLTVCVEEVQRITFSISFAASKLLFCLVKGKDPEVFLEQLLEYRQESQQHDTYHNMSKVSHPLVTNTTATTRWGSTEPSRLAAARLDQTICSNYDSPIWANTEKSRKTPN
uniref:Uncharacterized protein n=1 Tax=Oryzias latipes TaxID=8090 RepID=A0A3P9HD06_ORYLA